MALSTPQPGEICFPYVLAKLHGRQDFAKFARKRLCQGSFEDLPMDALRRLSGEDVAELVSALSSWAREQNAQKLMQAIIHMRAAKGQYECSTRRLEVEQRRLRLELAEMQQHRLKTTRAKLGGTLPDAELDRRRQEGESALSVICWSLLLLVAGNLLHRLLA